MTYSDTGTVLSGTPAGALARVAVAAGPLAPDPVPAELADQVLTGIAGRDLIDMAIDKAGRRQRRDRALPAWIVVYVLFGLCLFSSEGYGSVLRQVWPSLTRLRGRQVPVPHPSALPKARHRLGPDPLATLFDQTRGPLAGPDTPGAFQFGLRLVAIDGTTLDVPDSADNDAAFHRQHGNRLPRVRVVLLIECATHAVLAARFDGIQTSEHALTDAIIPDLQPGLLLLADRNFYGFNRWSDAAATGAHLLWRMRAGTGSNPSKGRTSTRKGTRKPRTGNSTQATTGKGVVRLPVHRQLPDGSYLSIIREPDSARRDRSRRTGNGTSLQRRRPEHTVRVIDATITITTSNNTTRREFYRLITTILDPDHAPTTELIACYQQRRESETSYAHLKTRLRGPRTVPRSHHPTTIQQEIWAYLCVYQTLCRIATTTAHHAGIDPDRISFTAVLRELKRTLTNPTDHPHHQILNHLLQQLLPNRRNRISHRTPKPSNRQPRTHTTTYNIAVKPPPQNP